MIDPPLTWREIQADQWILDEGVDIVLKLEAEKFETDDGTLIRKRGMALVPFTDGAYKGYDVVECIQTVVDAFPSHQFTGHILREGEDSGDIERLVVKDGKVVRQKATFAFPE